MTIPNLKIILKSEFKLPNEYKLKLSKFKEDTLTNFKMIMKKKLKKYLLTKMRIMMILKP